MLVLVVVLVRTRVPRPHGHPRTQISTVADGSIDSLTWRASVTRPVRLGVFQLGQIGRDGIPQLRLFIYHHNRRCPENVFWLSVFRCLIFPSVEIW